MQVEDPDRIESLDTIQVDFPADNQNTIDPPTEELEEGDNENLSAVHSENGEEDHSEHDGEDEGELNHLYESVEKKKKMYMAVMPGTRLISLLLGYVYSGGLIASLISVLVILHPSYFFISLTHSISISLNTVFLIYYHFFGSIKKILKNPIVLSMHVIFTLLVSPSLLFLQGFLVTMGHVIVFHDLNEYYTCYFMCLINSSPLKADEGRMILYQLFVFTTNLILFMCAVFSIMYGISLLVWLIYRESYMLLPKVEKFGIPDYDEKRKRGWRTRINFFQRVGFANSIGLIVFDVLGFGVSVVVSLFAFDHHIVFLIFYESFMWSALLCGVIAGAVSIVLKFRFSRVLTILANFCQAIAAITSVIYTMLVYVFLGMTGHEWHPLTITFMSLYVAFQTVKSLSKVFNFVVGLLITLGLFHFPSIVKDHTYYNHPSWKKIMTSPIQPTLEGDSLQQSPPPLPHEEQDDEDHPTQSQERSVFDDAEEIKPVFNLPTYSSLYPDGKPEEDSPLVPDDQPDDKTQEDGQDANDGTQETKDADGDAEDAEDSPPPEEHHEAEESLVMDNGESNDEGRDSD